MIVHPTVPTVLVLGGTEEGRALTTALWTRFGSQLRVMTSLAGGVQTPAYYKKSCLRVGPFGGVEGLRAYLRDERISAVLLATHPFAVTISHNVSRACQACCIPHLTLRRPPWVRTAADSWVEVDNMAEAVRKLPQIGRRAFLTIGLQQLHLFSALKNQNVWLLIRLLREHSLSFLKNRYSLVIGRGHDGNDLRLMRNHAIDVLVTKASGGAATEEKIAAARTLSLPVLMVRRPQYTREDSSRTVSTVLEAVQWMESTLAAQNS